MDTITRTFPLGLTSTTTSTVIELCHFRDMTFDADERVGIYLEAFFCNMSLKSFQIGLFPEFDGDETEAGKMALFNASENKSQKIGLKILTKKNNIGDWREKAEIILVNRGRKDYFDLLIPYLAKAQVRLLEKNDAIGIQLIDYGDGLLKTNDFIEIEAALTITISKKNDIKALQARVETLELALAGRITGVPANSLLGRNLTSGVVEAIPQTNFVQSIQGKKGDVVLSETDLPQFVNIGITQSIPGQKNFLNPIKTPYFEKDIYLKISSGIAWNANTWYLVPGLTINYEIGEIRCYLLTFNLQYSDGASSPVSYNHWQIGGGGILSSGIGWKADAARIELNFPLEMHNGTPKNIKVRTTNGISRGLEVQFDFPINISTAGFMEFFLKRLL